MSGGGVPDRLTPAGQHKSLNLKTPRKSAQTLTLSSLKQRSHPKMADDSARAVVNEIQVEITHCTVVQVKQWESSLRRFLPEPDERTRTQQLTQQQQLLQQVELPAFNPTTEAQFEDWLDQAAQKLRRPALCVDLFREAWLTACDNMIRNEVDEVPITSSVETYVDEVAKHLFPKSRFLDDEMVLLANAQPHENVRAAQTWFKFHVRRYLFLRRRWQCETLLTDAWLLTIALRCLPQQVSHALRLWYKGTDIVRIFETANHVAPSCRSVVDHTVHFAEQQALLAVAVNQTVQPMWRYGPQEKRVPLAKCHMRQL